MFELFDVGDGENWSFFLLSGYVGVYCFGKC